MQEKMSIKNKNNSKRSSKQGKEKIRRHSNKEIRKKSYLTKRIGKQISLQQTNKQLELQCFIFASSSYHLILHTSYFHSNSLPHFPSLFIFYFTSNSLHFLFSFILHFIISSIISPSSSLRPSTSDLISTPPPTSYSNSIPNSTLASRSTLKSTFYFAFTSTAHGCWGPSPPYHAAPCVSFPAGSRSHHRSENHCTTGVWHSACWGCPGVGGLLLLLLLPHQD